MIQRQQPVSFRPPALPTVRQHQFRCSWALLDGGCPRSPFIKLAGQASINLSVGDTSYDVIRRLYDVITENRGCELLRSKGDRDNLRMRERTNPIT